MEDADRIASTRGCAHEGFYSGQGRYSREAAQLRYVIVCDDCLAELRELAAIDYRPRFEPSSSHSRTGALAA